MFGLFEALDELLDKLLVRLLFVFTAVFCDVFTAFTVLVSGFRLAAVFLTPPGIVVCPPPLLLAVGDWLPPVVFLAAVAFVLLLLALFVLLPPLLLFPPALELLVTVTIPLLISTASTSGSNCPSTDCPTARSDIERPIGFNFHISRRLIQVGLKRIHITHRSIVNKVLNHITLNLHSVLGYLRVSQHKPMLPLNCHLYICNPAYKA